VRYINLCLTFLLYIIQFLLSIVCNVSKVSYISPWLCYRVSLALLLCIKCTDIWLFCGLLRQEQRSSESTRGSLNRTERTEK